MYKNRKMKTRNWRRILLAPGNSVPPNRGSGPVTALAYLYLADLRNRLKDHPAGPISGAA